MSYQPIENYGVIGNMRTVALSACKGSIDWFCYPDVDSPSIFGAILDDEEGGRFRLAPLAENVRRKQFYWPKTNILVTRFSTAKGSSSSRISCRSDFLATTLGSIKYFVD